MIICALCAVFVSLDPNSLEVIDVDCDDAERRKNCANFSCTRSHNRVIDCLHSAGTLIHATLHFCIFGLTATRLKQLPFFPCLCLWLH